MSLMLKQGISLSKGGNVSSTVINKIIPGQKEIDFYKLYKGELSNEFWKKLDSERRKLRVSICYCSLLDNCYSTEKNGVVEPVAVCPVEN